MGMMSSIYRKNRRFFSDRHERTLHAATTIANLVSEILEGPPQRVVDVGCGVGTFLHAFRSIGTSTIHGLEGDWLDPSHLVIERDELTQHDLEETLPDVGSFDLAICLELAEHLTPKRADSFIAELCGLAPAVLFSAAIPLQGGVGHVNEQWQSWWAERFASRGHVPADCIRGPIWNDDRIGIWYRQNTLLYLAEGHPARTRLGPVAHPPAMDLVHPAMFLDKVPGNSIPKAAKALRRATKRSIISGAGSLLGR